MRVTALALVAAAFAAACSSPPRDTTSSTGSTLLGNPDGSDAADHGCNVVLREIHIDENGGAVEQDCPGGGPKCFAVVRGTVDVSNAAVSQADGPMLLWRVGGGSWNVARVPAVAGGVLGFERHQFAIDAFDPNQPWPTVQMIPYLVVGSGSRLFDHNQNPAPYDNYVFDPNAQLSQPEDAAVCPGAPAQGQATAAFHTGWTDTLVGRLVPNGKLTVDYDLARAPQCESSNYNGFRAWDTDAFVRFEPSGVTLSKSVVGVQDAEGAWHEELFTVDVPAGATRAEMWFHTSGDQCTDSWDSNYGANWAFPVPSGS